MPKICNKGIMASANKNAILVFAFFKHPKILRTSELSQSNFFLGSITPNIGDIYDKLSGKYGPWTVILSSKCRDIFNLHI